MFTRRVISFQKNFDADFSRYVILFADTERLSEKISRFPAKSGRKFVQEHYKNGDYYEDTDRITDETERN